MSVPICEPHEGKECCQVMFLHSAKAVNISNIKIQPEYQKTHPLVKRGWFISNPTIKLTSSTVTSYKKLQARKIIISQSI